MVDGDDVVPRRRSCVSFSLKGREREKTREREGEREGQGSW